MDAELREHHVDPNTLQGRLGSPGSETQGDVAWQRALQEMDRLQRSNPRMN